MKLWIKSVIISLTSFGHKIKIKATMGGPIWCFKNVLHQYLLHQYLPMIKSGPTNAPGALIRQNTVIKDTWHYSKTPDWTPLGGLNLEKLPPTRFLFEDVSGFWLKMSANSNISFQIENLSLCLYTLCMFRDQNNSSKTGWENLDHSLQLS